MVGYTVRLLNSLPPLEFRGFYAQDSFPHIGDMPPEYFSRTRVDAHAYTPAPGYKVVVVDGMPTVNPRDNARINRAPLRGARRPRNATDPPAPVVRPRCRFTNT